MNNIYKLKKIYASLNPEHLKQIAIYHGVENQEHNNLAWMMAIDTIQRQKSQMPPVNVHFTCTSGMLGTICDLVDLDEDKTIATVTFEDYKDSGVSKVYPKRYQKLAAAMKEGGAEPDKIIYYNRIDVMESYQGQGWSSRINCTFYRNWFDQGYTHALLKDQADKANYWEGQIVDKGIGVEIKQEGQDNLYLIDLDKATTNLECNTIKL